MQLGTPITITMGGMSAVITKIGNATLMTNMTTALGFATFTLTNSKLLIEFGLVAAVNIMLLFILSLFVIPILYSYMSLPQQKHLASPHSFDFQKTEYLQRNLLF